MNEILLIDKEAGWTSHDVVNYVRKQLTINSKQKDKVLKAKSKKQRAKVGHAGTLDPFATGLLIVLVGKEATKRQDEFMKQDKEYEAMLELGKISDTGDTEGEITEYQNVILTLSEVEREGSRDSSLQTPQNDKVHIPNKAQISNVLKGFIGEIDQVPPAYSAIKINGKKAYEMARKGIDPGLRSRVVTIHDIKILDYKWPQLTIQVKCGSGTYIRSLARDIGEELGVGAYLTELRRTKIGKYDVKDAKKIGDFR